MSRAPTGIRQKWERHLNLALALALFEDGIEQDYSNSQKLLRKKGHQE